MQDNTNKKFWQRVAKLYAPVMNGNKNQYNQISSQIAQKLTPGTDMLELATGPGILSFALAHTGANIIATDFSEKMIEEAKKKPCSSNVRFEIADATSLLYENETFDVVLIANALHIMPEPDKAMNEIYRVLKPNGLLVAPTFIHGGTKGQLIRSRMMELIGFRTFHKWDSRELVEFIENHNFTVCAQKAFRGSMMPLCYIEANKD